MSDLLALRIIGAGLLTVTAGLFSGLTLGVLSLEPLDLEILIHNGTASESKYAKKIKPIRARGNWLLCTLVLANVAVYSAIPIVISDIAGGLFGFFISTGLSVIFGEIVPQAICTKHGLAIGASLSGLINVLMFLLAPLAWPLARLLDKLLGREAIVKYSKNDLIKLVNLHYNPPKSVDSPSDDDEEQQQQGTVGKKSNSKPVVTYDENHIIQGVLTFAQKTATDVMTPFKDIYMISIDDQLTHVKMVEIVKSGHSRIPVYENSKHNIVSMLIVKTLIMLDPVSAPSVRDIVEANNIIPLYVRTSNRLPTILNKFFNNRTHMAVVYKAKKKKKSSASLLTTESESEVTPHASFSDLASITAAGKYPIVEGVITLQDCIEEILGDGFNYETLERNEQVENAFNFAKYYIFSAQLANQNIEQSKRDLRNWGIDPSSGHLLDEGGVAQHSPRSHPSNELSSSMLSGKSVDDESDLTIPNPTLSPRGLSAPGIVVTMIDDTVDPESAPSIIPQDIVQSPPSLEQSNQVSVQTETPIETPIETTIETPSETFVQDIPLESVETEPSSIVDVANTNLIEDDDSVPEHPVSSSNQSSTD